MTERRRSGRCMVLGLGMLLALVLALPASVAADATTVTPATVGISVTFSGSGFNPNESLSVWETGADGNPTPVTGTQSDGNGGFSVPVSFPSAGQWQVTAHSITSGKEVVGTYAVTAAASTTGTTGTTISPTTGTTSVTTPTNTSSSGTAAPGALPAGIATPVTFSGSGFTANETISLWETAPDSKVTSLPQTQADSNGAFTAPVTFPSAGNWQVTAQGITSGRQVIGQYAVGTTTGTTAGSSLVPSSPSVNGPGFSTLPPVALGTSVTFSGSGFNGNETLSLWTTAPDAGTAALPPATADGTGAFTAIVTFPGVGNWQVTAHGKDSGHQVIGRYTVTSDGSAATAPTTPSSSVTAPATGATIPTTTGTVVTFIPSGYTAGETISVWSTAPEGTVTLLDPVVATSTGRAVITASFASEGLWQITAEGKDSHRVVIGRYQVATRTA